MNSNIVGQFGEDNINDSGQSFIEICELTEIRIAYDFYIQKDIHKYI